MYASMAPYAKDNFKELDILEFPWEKDLLSKISEKEYQKMLEVERISKAFFGRYDAQKQENELQA